MTSLPPPECDFDCWTVTERTRKWLDENKATLLRSEYGFDFWENPLYGDEVPVLATEQGCRDTDPVYNTQDLDLPVYDPTEKWS